MNSLDINEAMSLLLNLFTVIHSMFNSIIHNYFMSKILENVNMKKMLGIPSIQNHDELHRN